MKNIKPITMLCILASVFLFSKADQEWEKYTPLFMKRADLENSVKYVAGKHEMKEPGKIYVYGDKIFVNEKYQGVHIIDNSNPANPVQTGYIVVPGCLDMAVKGNIIYLDNAVDFVAFDMNTHKVTERIVGYFPEHVDPNGMSYYKSKLPKDMILVGWRNNSIL